MLVYIYTRVGNFKIFSLRVGKVLHAGKLLSGSSLHSFNRFYMLFLYGDHIHEAYSKWDLTKLLYRGTKFTQFSDTNDLLITAIIPHALLMLMLICFSKSSLPSITTPRSFSSSVYANSWCVSVLARIWIFSKKGVIEIF